MTDDELLPAIDHAAKEPLKTLALSNNQLSSLPAGISRLTSLHSLFLSNNQVSILPAKIGQLISLRSLELGNNRLNSLPTEIGNLTNLRSLDLSNNQLNSLPAEIGQLTSLQSLDLTNNRLRSLPAEIIRIANLRSLDISNNQLSSLPEKIGQLTMLRSLDLSNNRLGSLPREISKLIELRLLHLRNNQLQAIQQQLTRLPHVGTPLPKIWVGMRAALENYGGNRNYLGIGEYFSLCRSNQIKDPSDMMRLSGYLHDLGVCLHFQDDALLKHTVILSPEWATTAVYKVLDTQKVRKNLGRFTRDELKDIWTDDYAEKRDELLRLMMRFRLCYEIPGSPYTYIAPHLLSVEQPGYEWDDKQNLHLRYEYAFMPKGILTRFIVEMHRFIDQQTLVWKTGSM